VSEGRAQARPGRTQRTPVPDVFVPDVPVPVEPEVLVPEDEVPDEPEVEVPEVPPEVPLPDVPEPLPQPCELPVLLPLVMPVPPVDVAPDDEEPLMPLPEPSFILVELHAARLRATRPPMRMP
jgi:hypothetical protein